MANNPILLKMPLATDGEKATIPETAGSTTGNFSQKYGFQQINALPLQAGGIAPKREDFNGAFYLLGGIAYYAQKGWTFKYDSTQAYFTGCVVIDPTDNVRYECVSDVDAGGDEPHLDTDHWRRYTLDDKANITGSNLVYHKDVITTSGTYTAPVTGLYKITVKGGGGGGAGGVTSNNATGYYVSRGGGGGGEGGTTIRYTMMTAGQIANVIVGAGGNGGPASATANGTNTGGDGGDSSVTINDVTYTAGGAKGGSDGNFAFGGSGDINGQMGGRSILNTFSNIAAVQVGMPGAGNGGGGGYGGGTISVTSAGQAGGDGFAWFEYYTPGA